jgi:glutathione peroxidase-family protein
MTDLYDLTMTSITGEQIDLADFGDRVLLIVNVATN